MISNRLAAGKKISVIVTGATGMVGEGVLHECLQHAQVERVLIVNRKPSGVSHPKLTEIVHADFQDLKPIRERLQGYDACLYCIGTSSVGMKEAEYSRVAHEIPTHMAKLLAELNPGMTFCYISADGADVSERGRSMWARVQGKTENVLMGLPFEQVYIFRPSYIHPTKGLKNAHRLYAFISWSYPLLRRLMPGYVTTLRELGTAMIHAVTRGYEKSVLKSRDFAKLAKS
ncbi:NAD-dependent epimerase/dehydratase family protein [Cohnella endophytica]|uniref:NAD-dependent epimerase/dehydratase family protein n=1 Tax=Cohnella endophytica TaxID=2419778 RepID=A0A494XWS4_9BACL|nr:NAD-dependent epimerase/dehydratase family protein [Cohnella endophytica]RKP55057.1 NAD-dependent epimerase/dehydratase family protein [Cohnella endophytica]